jgi:hypothetical protein
MDISTDSFLLENGLLCYICGNFFKPSELRAHHETCKTTRDQQIANIKSNLPSYIVNRITFPNFDPPSIEIPGSPYFHCFFANIIWNSRTNYFSKADGDGIEQIQNYNNEVGQYFQLSLISCPNCKRTFQAGRLELHLRNCNTRNINLQNNNSNGNSSKAKVIGSLLINV